MYKTRNLQGKGEEIQSISLCVCVFFCIAFSPGMGGMHDID